MSAAFTFPKDKFNRTACQKVLLKKNLVAKTLVAALCITSFSVSNSAVAQEASVSIVETLKQHQGIFEESGPRGIKLKGKQTLVKELAKKYARTDAVKDLIQCLSSDDTATTTHAGKSVPLSWVCSEALSGLAYYMPSFRGHDQAKGWLGYVDLPASNARMLQAQRGWKNAMSIGRVRIPMNESTLKLKTRGIGDKAEVIDGDVIMFGDE